MPVRLFVGNLPYEATEAEIREHFGTIGPVTYCYLPTDRETGRPRGFAFVEYGDDKNAHEAIARLNNQTFRGRPLAVKEAQPRESRPPGSGPRPYGGPGAGGPRPPYSGGGGGPRPFQPREGAGGPGPAAPAGRQRDFGPDAPPRGKKKNQYKGSEQRGPKGPIRTKTDNRIYSAFDDGEETTAVDFDDFATSRPEDDQPEDE